MSVIGNPLLLSPEGYQIERSVRLRSSASAYFNRTPASAGNRKTWTWSGWVKRGTLSAQQGVFGSNNSATYPRTSFYFTSSDTLQLFEEDGTGANITVLVTTQVFRDPSAWYHVVLARDTTAATSSDRVKLYVNGVQITSFSSSTYPTLNFDGQVNNTSYPQTIGRTDGGNYLDGYLTEVNFIDGQALTPSSFGETDAVTGVWKPKKYAGTYGTNGFYLNFSDPSAATAAAIGKDSSGNGNNWTPNNISVTAGVTYDSMIDTPTPYADGGNGRGNYAVLNPLDKSLTDGSITNGNLTLNGTSNWNACRGSFGISSGKWYWETVHSVYDQSLCGIADSVWPPSTYYPGYSTTGYAAAYGNNALKYVDGVNTSYGATFTIGDVIGYALDMDAGTLTCYKNGVSQGEMVSGLTAYGTIFPAIAAANGAVINANFGQRPFAYTPPTGFKALNTQNLPEPTIVDGGEYFNPVLYTGNATARSITGVGFQPDFVWTKSRSGAESHRLYDSVRGATKSLYSNLTNAEATEAQSLTAFDSDGFSLGTGAPNTNAVTYVAWNWKESATAGFDIVTYAGQNSSGRTVAHSLGVKPAMIIIKNRSGAFVWNVQHQSLSGGVAANSSTFTLSSYTSVLQLNTTSAASAYTYDQQIDGVGYNLVAYLFAEVPGFSKFGSYTGNGSADGPFVFCGFRPAFVMMKRTDAVSSWYINDSDRSPDNDTTGEDLYPNLSDAQGGTVPIDILSNGFKMRTANNSRNQSGGTYIYAAFAEHPFSKALAR